MSALNKKLFWFCFDCVHTPLSQDQIDSPEILMSTLEKMKLNETQEVGLKVLNQSCDELKKTRRLSTKTKYTLLSQFKSNSDLQNFLS